MDEKHTFESLLREFITPIINSAVEQALARHLDQPQAQPQQQSFPDLMDIKMTAEYLHVARATVYSMTHKRAIPYYKRGGRLYFKKAELEQWVAGGRRMTIEEIKKAALESLIRGIGTSKQYQNNAFESPSK